MKKILPILSAILSLIPAILIGIIVSVGAGILCYFLSLIAGVLGFRIGKFLNDFVGERMIFTEGGFNNLLFAKLDAMYGPQIAGFLLGLIIPAVFLFVICPTRITKNDSSVNKMLKDRVGISKDAEKYVSPLIDKDSENISTFATISYKTVKTENESIYVTWSLESDDFINEQKKSINPNILNLYLVNRNDNFRDLNIDFNIDTKTLIPMNVYRELSYEKFDDYVNNYSVNQNIIFYYIERGKKGLPYNEDIVKWCKYFDLERDSYNKNDPCRIIEKTDYVHWYFDNGKQGSEDEYNAFKNKYTYLLNYNDTDYITDRETFFAYKEHGIPGFDNNVFFDIDDFDWCVKEFLKYRAPNDLRNDNLKKVITIYNDAFKTFLEEHWDDYPDSMKMHMDYEKENSFNSFSDYLDNLLISKKAVLLTSIVDESKNDFIQNNKLEDYIENYRASLQKAYYDSDDYQCRLNLYKQLVNYDNAKISATAQYQIINDYDGIEAFRNSDDFQIYYQVEIKTKNGWQKIKFPIELKNGKPIVGYPDLHSPALN